MDKRRSFKFTISSQYFIYFGVLGIFLPYFNLYCYNLGFSGLQIGVLSGLRSVAMVIFPLIWGVLADRLNIRRPIYILCNFVSTAIWIMFLFTAEFWPMLIITAFYGMFYAPIISFLEAVTMDVLGAEKKATAEYGPGDPSALSSWSLCWEKSSICILLISSWC